MQMDIKPKTVKTNDEFTPGEADNVDLEDVEEGEIIVYPILF